MLVDVDARPLEVPVDRPVRPPSTGGVDIDDPAIRAALADHIAGMERRWLDESIPALGGRTPRQAADDPIANKRPDAPREKDRESTTPIPTASTGARASR